MLRNMKATIQYSADQSEFNVVFELPNGEEMESGVQDVPDDGMALLNLPDANGKESAYFVALEGYEGPLEPDTVYPISQFDALETEVEEDVDFEDNGDEGADNETAEEGEGEGEGEDDKDEGGEEGEEGEGDGKDDEDGK